jgi:hypothetical protein
MEEYILVDGQRIPLPMGIRIQQNHTEYCAECGDGANEIFPLVDGGLEAWCMKCLKDVKLCTVCGVPKYFHHYQPEWGAFVCGNCEHNAKNEFRKKMVEGARRLAQKNDAALRMYKPDNDLPFDGPMIISFAKAVETYMSEILNRQGSLKERSERYCANNQLNEGIMTTLQFCAIITGIQGVKMGALEMVQQLAKMQDTDDAIDYIMDRHRAQAYRMLKYKKMDHDNLTEKGLTYSRYYERIKSKQVFYIGHKYDETTG